MTLHARLVKRYGPGPDSGGFLLDVELRAEAGLSVLFGASGAGKSLTLDCLAGFVRPNAGRVVLADAILFDAATQVNLTPRQRECGYVFQNYALFPHMTLRENLLFAAERRPRLERHRRVNEMLERLQLSDVAGRKPHEVSGGQRQRCSIGRALIAVPKLLLLDEPARGFDAALKTEFYELLRDLRREFHIPMLLVTHDLDEAVALGDHMFVYQDGRIVQEGSPQGVLSRPSSVGVARILGASNIVEGEVLALDPGRNSSRIRTALGELAGPYFPGYFLGDRAWLTVRADDLRVHTSPGLNRVRAILRGRVEHARFVELHFADDVTALVPRRDAAENGDAREWFIEFPAESIRLLPRG